MSVQPGVGYTFTDSSQGTTLNVTQPWAPIPLYGADDAPQQFECRVFKKPKEGGGFDFFLRTAKGVVDYTWSNFPFRPAPTYPGEEPYNLLEKQARITDWAVYQNGTRTAGTATSGPDFEWMAGNGYIKLPAGASGASMLVLMSKIDWWDRDGWLSSYRLVDAEMPFVSVIPTSDTTAMSTLATQQGSSTIYGGAVYFQGGISGFQFDPPYPLVIGYSYKKIAQLDWNDTTSEWDVTQYEYGPMNIRVEAVIGTMYFEYGTAPSPTSYDAALAAQFGGTVNHAWFEGTWAIPGYTLNPSNWWYHLVNT
jgi:hypothetical protein